MKFEQRRTVSKAEIKTKLGITTVYVNHLIRCEIILPIRSTTKLMPRFYPQDVCHGILLRSGDTQLRERAVVWLWQLESNEAVNATA
jgi:hypothetical protein